MGNRASVIIGRCNPLCAMSACREGVLFGGAAVDKDPRPFALGPTPHPTPTHSKFKNAGLSRLLRASPGA